MRNVRILGCFLFLTFSISFFLALKSLSREEPMQVPEQERIKLLNKRDEENGELSEQRKLELEPISVAREAEQKLNTMEPTEEAKSTPVYQMDPLLKEAYEIYSNYEHRDRNKAMLLFQKYIDKEPESIFLPQIYQIMGSMYGGNVNTKNGETINIKKMLEYYRKAHEEYAGKYSIEAAVVFNHLCFMPGTLDTRLEYYGWLLDFQKNGTIENTYGIRDIATCIKGFTPEFSEEELKSNCEYFKTVIVPQSIASTERQIYRDSFQQGRDTYGDLSVVARRYPDTELGRRAKMALDEDK